MDNNRKWMDMRRAPGSIGVSHEFQEGVKIFIETACKQEVYLETGKIRCPCIDCKNMNFHDPGYVEYHLLKRGFVPNYYVWTSHGESRIRRNPINHSGSEHINQAVQMVADAASSFYCEDQEFHCRMEQDPNPQAKKFYDLLFAADEPLYPGSTNSSQLSAVSRLLSIKSSHNMSGVCFNDICQFLDDVLPKEHKFPRNFYNAKKLVSELGLPVLKIDVCIKGCMLFWQENEDIEKCVICGRDRWKPKRKQSSKSVPYKQMHYFPITPRLQRLYASPSVAEHMTWHSTHVQNSDTICHPSEAESWKHFDRTYPSFAAEARNVRLGLCADGFTPFGQSRTNYSCWPVILTPYNLPPGMCMKTQYMFLTAIIPGPKNPKAKIDVYLQPLIKELKDLWISGVQTWDAYTKENFNMRASLLWTINDFPAYGMLSGWSTAGRLACPYCMENTKAFVLKHGHKISHFDCHRQFLPIDHPFRRNRKNFMRGRKEESLAPPRLTGIEVKNRVQNMHSILKKDEKFKAYGYGKDHNWTKRSIFWDLPYWHDNLIRHNLDIMHIEKNIFDNIFNTMMDVQGKTKDNAKSRQDLALYCDRKNLHLRENCTKKPKAIYCLDKDGRREICDWVHSLKFPDGYCSNLGSCVDNQEFKLSGMKSHDCHVFMQRLLPIAFRDLMPDHIWRPITELSLFFKEICSTTLCKNILRTLEEEIPVILCKLEKIFPPSFFDSMEHLPIHLPYEALAGGPVQYRWMYPFERFLFHLKKKIKNKAHVESSICNAYLVEETSFFCEHYFESHVKTRSRQPSRHEFISNVNSSEPNLDMFGYYVRPSGEAKRRYLTGPEYDAVHRYVLLNCPEIDPYVTLFISKLKTERPRITEPEISQAMDSEFVTWFRSYANDLTNDLTQLAKDLSRGPKYEINTYPMIFVNGYLFHTRSHGAMRSTYNSGVCVKGIFWNDSVTDFYGILEEIIEISYRGNGLKKVFLFNCEWFNPRNNVGTRVHEKYKLVDVNFSNRWVGTDTFVLAQQATQVFYSCYPTKNRYTSEWAPVMQIKARHTVEVPIVQSALQDDEMDGISIENDSMIEEDLELVDLQGGRIEILLDISENEVRNIPLVNPENSSPSEYEEDDVSSNEYDSKNDTDCEDGSEFDISD